MGTPDKADPDYYEEEIVWRRDARGFLSGLLKHWLWWTGSTIAGGVAALWQGGGHMIPGWLFSSFALSGLVIASFLTFRDQRRVAESKGLELSKEKRQRELEQNDWVIKIRDFETQITSIKSQLDDRENRRQIRGKLSAFLSKMEARFREINRMRPSGYVESIGDDLGIESVIMNRFDYIDYVRKLNDKTSFAIFREIYEYLEEVEQGKGDIFISFTGLERSPLADGESIEGVVANKRMEILDHLQHRQKNLLAMIKAME